MKKHIIRTLAALCMTAVLTVTAFADTSYGGDGWGVTFTGDEKLESSFQTTDLARTIAGLQPGDEAIITLTATNEHSDSTDWWMRNEVLSSLEDGSIAAGGVYSYRLSYTGADGRETVFFSSDGVGGESEDGLRSATTNLDDYFYLDTLEQNESGYLTLLVALDGETQGNSYQNTLADLQMEFAVELHQDTRGTVTRILGGPKTGDSSELLPYVIIAGISGVTILLIALWGRKNRKEEEAQ